MKTVNWKQTSFGFQAEVGEVLNLVIFYEHGWKVGINDRAMKHVYPSSDICKQVAINWAREKMRIIESELKQLEKVG